jgi:hypothetical protein
MAARVIRVSVSTAAEQAPQFCDPVLAEDHGVTEVALAAAVVDPVGHDLAGVGRFSSGER